MIDYKIISDSINYYESKGFIRIETPWTVSEYIDNLTKPKDFLPKGQFQTTTPCFRFESFDYSHTKYFIKNELIKTDVVNNAELDKVVEYCFNFLKGCIPEIEIIQTSIGFDIEYKGNELGSYGIRENEFLKWIYATGCAEPRLSKIINLYKNGLS